MIALGPASCRAPAPAAPEFVWWKAEGPKEINYPTINPFAAQNAAGGHPERRVTRGAERIVLLPDVMYYLIEPV